MKRGGSGLSLVLPINKPSGMTSHDVVNRVRRVFGEKRVGHAGTLDPLAEGVLPILVGPAARLDKYMVEHDKTYTVDIVFGVSTTTDDIEGNPLHFGDVPSCAFDKDFAQDFCSRLVGKSKQLPPVYSAIKINGKKACDEARKGNVLELQPRDIEIYSADLLDMGNGDPYDSDDFRYDGRLFWTVRLSVSKGTYIRSIARDVGTAVGTFAHVGRLVRESVGDIDIEDCITLDSLDVIGKEGSIDPMRILRMRIAFPRQEVSESIQNGRALDVDLFDLFERSRKAKLACSCCAPSIVRSCDPPRSGESFAVIVKNVLRAIYVYDGDTGKLKPDCVFQIGVSRGCDI